MQYLPLKSKFGLFILMLFSIACKAQPDFVDLKTGSGKSVRKFEVHTKSNIDVVNGKMNVAIQSSNGYLLEINGLSAAKIPCGKTIPNGSYEVVLIDSRMDKTYVLTSKSKPVLKVKCLSNGMYEFTFTGDLFQDKERIKAFARLRAAVNHSRNLKTN